VRPGSSREPQWCPDEAAAQHCGLTSEKRVTPVCWTSLSTAQLTARAWDQGKGLLPEPLGSPGATALAGSDDCLKQLGVPGGGLGGYFLDKPGKLAAIRQQRRGAVSTPAPGSACGRGRPGRSGAGRLIDVAVV
jgi:hypothetical protein